MRLLKSVKLVWPGSAIRAWHGRAEMAVVYRYRRASVENA